MAGSVCRSPGVQGVGGLVAPGRCRGSRVPWGVELCWPRSPRGLAHRTGRAGSSTPGPGREGRRAGAVPGVQDFAQGAHGLRGGGRRAETSCDGRAPGVRWWQPCWGGRREEVPLATRYPGRGHGAWAGCGHLEGAAEPSPPLPAPTLGAEGVLPGAGTRLGLGRPRGVEAGAPGRRRVVLQTPGLPGCSQPALSPGQEAGAGRPQPRVLVLLGPALTVLGPGRRVFLGRSAGLQVLLTGACSVLGGSAPEPQGLPVACQSPGPELLPPRGCAPGRPQEPLQPRQQILASPVPWARGGAWLCH